MKKYWIAIVAFLPLVAMGSAYRKQGGGIGDLAQNILGPAMNLKDLIQAVCLLTAAGLLIGSFILFVQHRKNPIEVPLSRPIAMIAVAVALFLLTLIPIGI